MSLPPSLPDDCPPFDAAPEAQPQTELEEPARKRSKRGKYVGNACDQCKRRKIKCLGGRPCNQCVAKRMNCTSNITRPEASTKAKGTKDTASASVTTAASKMLPSTIESHELLSRLMTVEWQLKSVLSKEKAELMDMVQVYTTPEQSADAAVTDRASPDSRNTALERRMSCVGEKPASSAIKAIETRLDDAADLFSQRQESTSTPTALTPKPDSNLDARAEKDSRLWLRTILLSFGIVPEKQQWLKHLELFFAEIHVLFPFLHPPTVWASFDHLWQRSLFLSSNDITDDLNESKVSVAVLFLCLANGRCAASSRADEADGKHSAGWSLYSVAMYLLGEVLDLRREHPSSLISTQALMLMVIYLFGLGATQKAEMTLAQAISSAHILGLHRQVTYRDLPPFEKEMFRRLWWSIYVLDRRISLETGRPFMIHDINTNVEYPKNMSDECLQRLKTLTAQQDESMAEKQDETPDSTPSHIPHLHAMISYSKIVGDVWRVVYCDDSISLAGRNVVDVYLEPLLEQARKTMPPELCYQPAKSFEEQFSGMQWSQIKQCLLMYLRYTFLKLMIRKPPPAVMNGTHQSTLKNDYMCCELASNVAFLFDAIPSQYPKVSFPFINYLANATMIMFNIVDKNPEFKKAYRSAINSAVRTLKLACHLTWVSGKLIRTISTLDQLTRSTFGPMAEFSVLSSTSVHYGGTQFYETDIEKIPSRPLQNNVSPTITSSTKTLLPDTSIPFCLPRQQQQQQQQQQKNQHLSPGSEKHRAFTHVEATCITSPPKHMSRESAITLITPSLSEKNSTLQQYQDPFHPRTQEQQPQLEPIESSTHIPLFVPLDVQDSAFSDLPAWAMADFDFEQEISAHDNDMRGSFGFWDLPNPDFNTIQHWGNGF